MGIASYTSMLAKHTVSEAGQSGFFFDQDVSFSFDPSWPSTQAPWIKIVPEGLRHILGWIKAEYDNPEVLIGETGVCVDEGLEDKTRADFFTASINEVMKAIVHDGCNVTGYIGYSLLDGFGWECGYT